MAKARVVKGMHGRGMGANTKIEHPFRILKQIIGFVAKYYKGRLIIVMFCSVASIFANLQGTYFT